MPGFTLRPGADPATIAEALSGLEHALRRVAPALADRVMIATGEVAANAADHGHAPVTVTWCVRPAQVVVDVAGPGPEAAEVGRATLPPPDATRGRGLYLVRSLASRVTDGPQGLRLVFELAGLDPLDPLLH